MSSPGRCVRCWFVGPRRESRPSTVRAQCVSPLHLRCVQIACPDCRLHYAFYTATATRQPRRNRSLFCLPLTFCRPRRATRSRQAPPSSAAARRARVVSPAAHHHCDIASQLTRALQPRSQISDNLRHARSAGCNRGKLWPGNIATAALATALAAAALATAALATGLVCWRRRRQLHASLRVDRSHVLRPRCGRY